MTELHPSLSLFLPLSLSLSQVAAPLTHVPPSAVSYQSSEGEGEGEGDKFTLIMTDPDAPDRSEHLFREFVHYVINYHYYQNLLLNFHL